MFLSRTFFIRCSSKSGRRRKYALLSGVSSSLKKFCRIIWTSDKHAAVQEFREKLDLFDIFDAWNKQRKSSGVQKLVGHRVPAPEYDYGNELL